MRFPWSKAGREERADSYTDRVVAAVLESATGGENLSQAVASLEIAAGFWARAFASAKVLPESNRTAPITASLLAWTGRQLVTNGEAIAVIEVDENGLRLLPASDVEITGAPDPTSWRYRLEVSGPSRSISARRPAEAVIHCRYGATSTAPWRGRAPWTAANVSAGLISNLEGRLKQEASAKVGQLIAVPIDPQEKEDDPLESTKATLKGLKGGVALVESLMGGYGEKAAAPREDWRPQRIGADPPQTLEGILTSTSYRLLSACGIPPGLVRPGADGTGQRESWRQFLHGTISPVAKEVEVELSQKLATEITLDFSELYASDLSGRARAFGSLVQGGLDPDRAATLAGLLEDA